MSAALLNARASQRRADTGEWGRSPPLLKIVLLYDDTDMAREAEALVARVAPRDTPVVQSVQFRELSTPPSIDENLSGTPFMVSEADMLLVAVGEETDLPAGVKSWFRHWLSLRDPSRHGALVALFKNVGTESGASLARIYLETVATLAGLEFFPGWVAEAGHAVSWAQTAGSRHEAGDEVAPRDIFSVHDRGPNE